MEFHFRRYFRLQPKMKNAFRSASSIGLHHKKGLGLGIGLGLERILKSWSWS